MVGKLCCNFLRTYSGCSSSAESTGRYSGRSRRMWFSYSLSNSRIQRAFQLFRRKVAIWAELFHRNVVKVHGMVYTNDGPYVVCRFSLVFDKTDA